MSAKSLVAMLAVVVWFGAPPSARAHCDTLDGPVVAAAQRALDTGEVTLALVWVEPDAEQEVRAAFARTLTVRRLGPEARALADRFFFETVVRLHRAGEGEPFTGLKPAGTGRTPAILAADRAMQSGSLKELEHLLLSTTEHQLADRFAAAQAAQAARAPLDLESGRAAVKAYVELLTFVEEWEAAVAGLRGAEGHP